MDNTIFAIFGRKGSGKTTLTREIIKEQPRVFVIDTLAEYTEGFDIYTGKQASVEAMMSVQNEKRFRLALRVLDLDENLGLIDLAYEFPNTMLVVEETSLFARPTLLPTPISQLVRYGRHRQIDQVYISRRPSEVHRDLTAQADLIISFYQQEPRDVKYLRDFAGDAAERVRTLPKYKVFAYGDLEKAPMSVLNRIDRTGQMTLDTPQGEGESPPNAF